MRIAAGVAKTLPTHGSGPARAAMPNATLLGDDDALARIGVDQNLRPLYVESGGWEEIWITLKLDACICFSLLLLFELARRKTSVYLCRLKHALPDRRPRDVPPKHPFAWLHSANGLSDAELRHCVGLDAYCALSFLKMCRGLFGWTSLASTALLLAYKNGASHLQGFYGLTLGNCEHVLEDRWRLWLAVVFTYAFTAAAIYLATREARHYLRHRQEYLRRGDGAGESPQPRCSVLVENVPPRLRSDAAVRQYFAALFGNRDVHSAVSFVDCAHLEQLLDARDAAADAYAWRSVSQGYGYATITSDEGLSDLAAVLSEKEAAVAKCQDSIRDAKEARAQEVLEAHALLPTTPTEKLAHRPSIEQAASKARDASLQAISFLGAVAGLNDTMRRHSAEDGASSTGIVTFYSPAVASDAAQLVLTARRGDVHVSLAPPASDMLWPNVPTPKDEVDERLGAANVGLFFLALLWTPLVASVQALCNLEVLAHYWAALKPLAREERYESLRILVSGTLPVYIMLALLGVLPIVLDAVAVSYAGVKTKSAAHAYVASRYLYFQLLQIFVTVASGSLLSVMREFLDHPKTLLDLLGKALPGMGSYFLQLVIAKVLFSLAFELARPTALLGVVARQGVTRSKYFKVPARVRRRLRRPPDFDYGSYLPDFMLVVLVGTIFAPIAPVVALVCFAYFAVAVRVYSHQFLYVYVRAYETGGAFPGPTLARFFFLALVVGHLTLIGHLILLDATHQAAALAPLVLFTLRSRLDVRRTFELPARYLDRENAMRFGLYETRRANRDATPRRRRRSVGESDNDSEKDDDTLAVDYYIQPALAAGPVEFDSAPSSEMVSRAPVDRKRSFVYEPAEV